MTFTHAQISVYRDVLDCAKSWIDDERSRAEEWGRCPDWPWNGFVLSHATTGGSANWDRIALVYNDSYKWDVLIKVEKGARNRLFASLGNPRFRTRVAGWAESNFQRLNAMGGPAKARGEYDSLDTAKKRIAWVQSFCGFGAKYGRNIPMDAFDRLVTKHFALDHRLRQQLGALGYPETSYARGEELLNALAKQLGTDAWTMDRVAYRCHNCIIAALRPSGSNIIAQAASS